MLTVHNGDIADQRHAEGEPRGLPPAVLERVPHSSIATASPGFSVGNALDDSGPYRAYQRTVNRLTKDPAIEKRLLDLAYTTAAKITPTALAYFAPCSIEDASRVLDRLASHDRLQLEVEDDGSLVYDLRNRQQLGAPMGPAVTALAPIEHTRNTSPVLAAVLSAFVPGAGHIYTGRLAAALVWFIVVGIAYALILPGLILHVASMISAARSARQLNAAPGHAPQRLLFVPPS